MKAETLEEVLKAWRWDADTNEAGDIVDLQFQSEKLGDDKVLLNAIAPFVKEGSYIKMHGEDNSTWRWHFDGKTCVEKAGTVSFE